VGLGLSLCGFDLRGSDSKNNVNNHDPNSRVLYSRTLVVDEVYLLHNTTDIRG